MARTTLKRIAFLAPRIDEETRRYASGVCRVASPKHGMVVRDFPVSEQQLLHPALLAWKPHAVVSYIANEHLDQFQPLLDSQVPVVNMARGRPTKQLAIVIADAQELYDHVHQVFGQLQTREVWQLAFGEQSGPFSTQARYREYTKQRDIPYHSLWVEDPFISGAPREFSEVDPAFGEWLATLPKPVGIFSQHLFAGYFLARACELAGLKVPDEVAIIGTDPLDVANSSRPPVTSVRSPAREIGKQAARLASVMMDGAAAPKEIVSVSGMTLVPRASTGPAPQNSCDIDRALRFIDRHACEGLKVNDLLAETQSVSRTTFHKHFSEVTGMTPAQAIQQRRMSEARWLLTDSQMSPSSISGLCGYVDYMHFYRVFRKSEGISPNKYRKLTS